MIRIPPLQFATLLVASLWVAQALLRVLHAEFNILRFAVLGWPPWAVWATSAAEIAGALMLLHPRSFAWGGILLALVAGLFLWTYAGMGALQAGYGHGGLLAAVAGLLLLRRLRRASAYG